MNKFDLGEDQWSYYGVNWNIQFLKSRVCMQTAEPLSLMIQSEGHWQENSFKPQTEWQTEEQHQITTYSRK